MRGSHELANVVRQMVKQAMADMAWPQIYLISGYDQQNVAVKVNVNIDPTMQPIESNWMPLGAIGVGNGWGVSVGPQIGDQVLVVFENGDINSGVIVARLFSTQAQPMPVPSGEIWAMHSTGSSLKFTTNGDVNLNTAGNLNATVAGNAIIKAASIVLKNAGTALKALLNSAFATWAAGHSHPANGAPPSVLPDSTMQTTIVQAE